MAAVLNAIYINDGYKSVGALNKFSLDKWAFDIHEICIDSLRSIL